MSFTTLMTVKSQIKLREAKATTLGIVLRYRSSTWGELGVFFGLQDVQGDPP